jgi:integrase
MPPRRCIQALYSQLLDRKLSARTIRYTHAVFFSALRQAVRWKLLLSNPAENIDLPRQPRRRSTVLDVEQAKQFIASTSGDEYEPLFALALSRSLPACGPASTWRSPGRTSISTAARSRFQRSSNGGKGGWRFEDAKLECSRRMIKLQNWVVDLLRTFEEEDRPAETKSSGLVFKAQRGGPIQEAKFVGR